MSALSLRADEFDGPVAIAYRVLGLGANDSAIIRRNAVSSTWTVLLGEVGGALRTAGLAFPSLSQAVSFLEEWTRTGGGER